MLGLFVNHIHVFPRKVRREGSPDAFVEIANDLGIEGGVFFAPFAHQWPDGDPNGWLARELRRHRQYLGFGTLDPQKPARDQVTRVADLGLSGIKIHGPAQHFPLNCDWVMDAYEQMERIGLVADFHLGVHGYRIKDYHPLLLDEVAHRFPDLAMILEHVGGWHFCRDAVAVIANHQFDGNSTPVKNNRKKQGDATAALVPDRAKPGGWIYAGIASVLDRAGNPGWYLGPEGVAEIAWQIGINHLIYGTDFPYNGQERIAADLAIIRGMGLSTEPERALLGGNLRELLGLQYVDGQPI
jgi:predicted TIM-barrel fold metal-dependent hydrolase